MHLAAKTDYDLRRAAMFLKLLRYSYSSGGKSFACQPFNIAGLFGLIQQVGECQRRFDFVVFRRLKNAGKQWCGNVEKLGLSLLKEGIDNVLLYTASKVYTKLGIVPP